MPQTAHPRAEGLLPTRTLLGFVAAIAALVLILVLSLRSLSQQAATREGVIHAFRVLTAEQRLFSEIQDAETGQRGYLLTGEERYLEPYRRASGAVPTRRL